MQPILNHLNDIGEILFTLVYTALSLGTSTLFWLKDKNSGLKHLLISMHSALLLLILTLALLAGIYGYSNRELMPLFYSILALPIASILASLVYLKGPKWIHLAHIWNAIAFAWTWFVGSMAVSGDWL